MGRGFGPFAFTGRSSLSALYYPSCILSKGKFDLLTANTRRCLALIPLILILGWLGLHWPHGSLWYDEGLTAWIVSGPWSRILTWCTQVDIQVPLHYFVLKLWITWVGNSEFTLHTLSALCGLIAVAGIPGRRRCGTFWACRRRTTGGRRGRW